MRTATAQIENRAIPACGIAVMAKASIPGRSKTRLVPPLTFEEAARCNTAFLRDIADNIVAASARASIAGHMAFGPPQSKPFFQQHLPGEIGLIEAWYPNFGDCLFAAIAQLLERGHARRRRAQFRQPHAADGATGRNRAGAGAARRPRRARSRDRRRLLPARCQAAHRRLFQDIDWSTEHVARQTLERAAELGLPVHVPAGMVRRGRHPGVAHAAGGTVRGRLRSRPELRPNQPQHTHALMRSLVADAELHERLASDDAFGSAAE